MMQGLCTCRCKAYALMVQKLVHSKMIGFFSLCIFHLFELPNSWYPYKPLPTVCHPSECGSHLSPKSTSAVIAYKSKAVGAFQGSFKVTVLSAWFQFHLSKARRRRRAVSGSGRRATRSLPKSSTLSPYQCGCRYSHIGRKVLLSSAVKSGRPP